MTAFWISCAAFPWVVALHRYAVRYGFAGKPRRVAMSEAIDAGLGAALVSLTFAAGALLLGAQ
jgi:hypothetical protein